MFQNSVSANVKKNLQEQNQQQPYYHPPIPERLDQPDRLRKTERVDLHPDDPRLPPEHLKRLDWNLRVRRWHPEYAERPSVVKQREGALRGGRVAAALDYVVEEVVVGVRRMALLEDVRSDEVVAGVQVTEEVEAGLVGLGDGHVAVALVVEGYGPQVACGKREGCCYWKFCYTGFYSLSSVHDRATLNFQLESNSNCLV